MLPRCADSLYICNMVYIYFHYTYVGVSDASYALLFSSCLVAAFAKFLLLIVVHGRGLKPGVRHSTIA